MQFPETSKTLNDISTEEGKRIFQELRTRYFENTIVDLDIILNSLCFALLCLRKSNCGTKDFSSFNLLVVNILNKNK